MIIRYKISTTKVSSLKNSKVTPRIYRLAQTYLRICWVQANQRQYQLIPEIAVPGTGIDHLPSGSRFQLELQDVEKLEEKGGELSLYAWI